MSLRLPGRSRTVRRLDSRWRPAESAGKEKGRGRPHAGKGVRKVPAAAVAVADAHVVGSTAETDAQTLKAAGRVFRVPSPVLHLWSTPCPPPPPAWRPPRPPSPTQVSRRPLTITILLALVGSLAQQVILL